MDQSTRCATELDGVTEKCAVLEPGGVPPVVGDQPGKGHPECGVLIPRVRLVVGADGDVDVLPSAPVPGGRFSNRGVVVCQQPAVRLHQAAVALGGRDAVAEARPLLGDHATHRTPANGRCRGGAAAALVEQHDSVGAGIELAPPPRPTACPRSAVQDDGRLPVRVAAGLPVDEVAVTHVEAPVVVRLLEIQSGSRSPRRLEPLGRRAAQLRGDRPLRRGARGRSPSGRMRACVISG